MNNKMNLSDLLDSNQRHVDNNMNLLLQSTALPPELKSDGWTQVCVNVLV